jgi:hypothetical protein
MITIVPAGEVIVASIILKLDNFGMNGDVLPEAGDICVLRTHSLLVHVEGMRIMNTLKPIFAAAVSDISPRPLRGSGAPRSSRCDTGSSSPVSASCDLTAEHELHLRTPRSDLQREIRRRMINDPLPRLMTHELNPTGSNRKVRLSE